MEPRRGFYDLCVPYQADKDALTNILTELYTRKLQTHSFLSIYSLKCTFLLKILH